MTEIEPPHPSPLPQGGEGERGQIFKPFKTCTRLENEQMFMIFKLEFGSISQVGVTLQNNTVSPLSLRERVRVRGSF
ncbi:hypothetical protein [Pseudomonas paraglycinae]|uniref:hypothetical protein n=1 Tax=Pseudomonas paraglycinae TaxID=2892330 RepID=UPI003FCEEE70